jgi:hypothetical protein
MNILDTWDGPPDYFGEENLIEIVDGSEL